MNAKILTPAFHGLLDYAAAAGLTVLPFLLDLDATSQLARWLSVVGGFGLVAYSLATDYAFGVLRVLSYRVHLMLDVVAAVVFLAAPLVFGWSGLVLVYYVVMGIGVLAVVALSTTGRDAVPAADIE